MKDKAWLGIDPGSCSGCIALINNKEEVNTIEFGKMTTQEWFDALSFYERKYDCTAILEKVHGMPGMSVVAISAFMKNVGHIEMALISLHIPFKEVTPQSWMKFYGMKKEKTESKTEWKRRLRELLQRLMPNIKVTNDTADAILIARYCYLTNK